MFFLFFDLDDTILNLTKKERNDLNRDTKFYVTKKDINIAYKNINNRPKLKNLLNCIKNPKYILTNANNLHATLSLKNMNLYDNFNKIIDRDLMKCLKPNIQAYKVAMDLVGIKNPQKCFLFDDQIPNLLTAKLIGWTTIYIGKSNHNNINIDFSFNNIYEALLFFLDI